MPVWLPYIGTIISALAQLAKLMFDLAKEKNHDQMKECSLEIEKARLSGNTTRLTSLIEKLSRGEKCK